MYFKYCGVKWCLQSPLCGTRCIFYFKLIFLDFLCENFQQQCVLQTLSRGLENYTEGGSLGKILKKATFATQAINAASPLGFSLNF